MNLVEHSFVLKPQDPLPSINTTEIIQHDKISANQDSESKLDAFSTTKQINSSSDEHNDVTENVNDTISVSK